MRTEYYQIRCRGTEGETATMEVSGQLFSIDKYRFGATKYNNHWVVTELSTGADMQVPRMMSKTLKDAMWATHGLVKRLGEEAMDGVIDSTIAHHGELNEGLCPRTIYTGAR